MWNEYLLMMFQVIGSIYHSIKMVNISCIDEELLHY